MNEHLWLTENDPLVLLDDLYPRRTHGSDQPQTRECRMYLLACARRWWDRMPGVFRGLVALSERYAESPRAEKQLRADVAPVVEQLMRSDGKPSDLWEAETELSSLSAWAELVPEPAPVHADPLTPTELRALAALVYLPLLPNTPPFTWVPAERHSATLLREIYYNPHHRVLFDPKWRTTDVRALAQQMYDTREFSAMPILADALQDAGCGDEAMLGHCRDEKQLHVRGCWVLDRVLDRR